MRTISESSNDHPRQRANCEEEYIDSRTPAALAKVIRAASDPNGSLQDLGRVCAQDAGLTVELLRIANSPRYGFADQVRNVPQAVVALDTVRFALTR